MDPWEELKRRIDEAASKPCALCSSCEDVRAPHDTNPKDRGDLGTQVIIIPLCKMCRRKFFVDERLREVLMSQYPEQVDYISF